MLVSSLPISHDLDFEHYRSDKVAIMWVEYVKIWPIQSVTIVNDGCEVDPEELGVSREYINKMSKHWSHDGILERIDAAKQAVAEGSDSPFQRKCLQLKLEEAERDMNMMRLS